GPSRASISSHSSRTGTSLDSLSLNGNNSCPHTVGRPMSFISAALDKIAAPERRTLAVAGGAHILHDGFTDLLYVLLPLWQAEFGLGYAEVGLLRALYAGAMAGFQLPAGVVAERIGGPLLLG